MKSDHSFQLEVTIYLFHVQFWCLLRICHPNFSGTLDYSIFRNLHILFIYLLVWAMWWRSSLYAVPVTTWAVSAVWRLRLTKTFFPHETLVRFYCKTALAYIACRDSSHLRFASLWKKEAAASLPFYTCFRSIKN